MGDHQNGLFIPAGRFFEQGNHLACVLRIQITGRLVGQNERRPGDECAADGDALLLPAGQLTWQMVAAFVKAKHCEQFLQIGFVRFLVIEQHRKNDVLLDGQLRDEIKTLEDEADIAAAEYGQIAFLHRKNVLAVDSHTAAGRRVQRADQVEQRRFA